MTYNLTPEQMSLLNLAQKTWNRRASAKRHGMFYSEETITETNLLDLADMFPGQVSIVQFNKVREGQTGADWAWSFVSANGHHNMPMLVQAKLLDLRDTAYPEIRRLIGRRKPPRRQIDQLIDTARQLGFPAVYAFYNHLNDTQRVPNYCRSLQMAGTAPMPQSWGVAIADAYNVRLALDDQSFDTHRHHSIALHCLLCSHGSGHRPAHGSPALALQALRQLRMRGVMRSPVGPLDHIIPPLPDEPRAELPELFQVAREIAAIESDDARQVQTRLVADRYPALAGVIILRDGGDP